MGEKKKSAKKSAIKFNNTVNRFLGKMVSSGQTRRTQLGDLRREISAMLQWQIKEAKRLS